MKTVTISPKFQVVIPKEIRERMKLVPGQKMVIFPLEGRIELLPSVPMKAMRGFAKGLVPPFVREEEDRY